MSWATLELGGPLDCPLRLTTLERVLNRPLRVTLHPRGLERVRQGRAWIEEMLRGSAAVYGVNTGFGPLKDRRIALEQLDRLQENLLISHAVGVGPPAPPEVVRWMLLCKIHMLLAGHSGVRVELVERLASWVNADLLPVVPTRGSLGASGDLAPLAHLFLPLLGRGAMSVEQGGQRRAVPAGQALAAAGIDPLPLKAKEGLALINGTQFMSAYAAHIAVRARRLADLADLVLCMSLEAARGSVRPADARLHELRPHPGAGRVAANIRRHMADSEILASHAQCDRVQDPYSLRCAPQVHGAFRDALEHACEVIEREINSVTDNPVLLGPQAAGGPGGAEPPDVPAATQGQAGPAGAPADGPQAISGGNFHGAPLALVLDYLAIALTDLASISERRTYLLLSGIDGLPPLLMRDTGLNSGLMLPQYTAAALVNECKVLASPAAVDSIPTALGQEDHVSMGATSALKCWEVLDRVETVLAIELLCAAQALDYRAPLRPGVGPRAAHAVVRRRIPHADADRPYGEDMAVALDLLRGSEELLAIARGSS